MPNNSMPYNLEAERSVLGCVLIDQVVQVDILTELKEDDFLVPTHRKIFTAMRDIYNDNQPVDIVTLADYMQKSGTLESVGGLDYLTLLADFVPSSANYKQHLDLIVRDGILRRLITASNTIIENAYNSKSSRDSLDLAQKLIFEIGEQKDKYSLEKVGNYFQDVMNMFEKLQTDKTFLTGIKTGFTELDSMINGLHKGNLIILAARPSVGKTTFAMNIAENIAIKDPNAVIAVFALEMTKQELAQRMICSVGNVNMDLALKGKLDDDGKSFQKLWDTMRLMGGMNIFVDESSYQTPQTILSKCRRLKAQLGRLDLVIVDHIQLMDSAVHAESRQQQITDISRKLKMAAKELDVPLIALSQLSRQVTNRNGGKSRPVLSDLRESGAIEQDADVVIFLHRPEEKSDKNDEGENAQKKALGTEDREVIVEKNRNGRTGLFEVLFKGDFVKFVNKSRAEAPSYMTKAEENPKPQSEVESEPFDPESLPVPDEEMDDDPFNA